MSDSSAVLTQCFYCGKYSVVLMNHGPGRCTPKPPAETDSEPQLDLLIESHPSRRVVNTRPL